MIDHCKTERLRINEIFHSLQGEADAVGFPTVFVRLTGCPLRCQYCDTEYAFHAGEWLDLDAIVETVRGYGAQHVCVTGRRAPGAAELHDAAAAIVRRGLPGVAGDQRRDGHRRGRCARGAGGGCEDAGVGAKSARNRIENFPVLTRGDQLKFVICSREDYDWSKEFCESTSWPERCQVLFSPSYNQVAATDLADWILADRLPVRFQLQLHKVLWGDVPGK